MKSRTLSFSLMMETFKRQIWVFAVSCLAYFLVFPVNAVMSIGQWKDIYGVTLELMQKLFFWSLYGSPYGTAEQLSTILCVTVLLGILSAVEGFSYLHSKTKVDFYHSLPIKKEKLFFNQLAVSVMTYLIPAFIGMILMIGVGALNNVFTLKAFGGGLAAVLIGLVFYVMSFSLTALAMLLTGRLLVGVLGTAVFFGYSILLQQIVIDYCEMFFHNNYTGNEYQRSLISGMGTYGSPFGIANYVSQNLNQGNGWLATIVSAGITGVFLVLCLFAYRKRPSEAAGSSMAFSKVAVVVKVILVTTAALLMGMIARNVNGGSKDGWFVFGLVFGLLLFHCIIQMIYQPDIRQILSGKLSFLVTAILVVAISCSFRFDLLGYDRYLPEQDEIVNLNVVTDSLFIDSWGMYSEYKQRLDKMELGNGNEMYQLAKHLIAGSKKYQEELDKMQEDETYENELGSVLPIYVKYELKSGRSVYRSYTVYFEDIREDIERLSDNEQYLNDLYPIRTIDDPGKVEQIQLTSLESSVSKELYTAKDDRRIEFVKALQKDMQTLNGDIIANEIPVGRVYYDRVVEDNSYIYNQSALSIELYKMGQHSSVTNEMTYIYPSFTNTLAILKEMGFKMEPQFDPEKISQISVYDYRKDSDEYAEQESTGGVITETKDEDDEVEPEIYTERSDIEEILPSLIWYDLASLWDNTNGDFRVELSMTNGYGTEDTYICYVRKDRIPHILNK